MIKNLKIIVCLLSAATLFSCHETLPPYSAPEHALILKPLIASQGVVGAGTIVVNVLIEGENRYEEVFQDTINVNGNLTIYWEDRPEYIRNIPLNNTQFLDPTPIQGRTLTLDPGEKFSMQVVWFLDTDDGLYIPDSLDYSDRLLNGILYANPETFIMKASMTLFNQLGLLETDPFEFILSGFGKVTEQNEGEVAPEQG